MGDSKVLTGVRARFKLGGVVVGYATGVSARESITYEPVKTLNNVQVAEHAPVDYDVSLTADFVRIVGESMKSAGYMPKVGQSPEEHIRNIVTMPTMTAVLEDNVTGKIVRILEEVKMADTNLNIMARGVVGENVTFVAKRSRDEADA